MAETENITITSYDEFKQQLEKAKEDEVAIILSFYKYCYKYEPTEYKMYKQLICKELKTIGLKPVKITKNMDLIFRYKKEAEAIIYIKPYRIDLLIHRF